MLDEEDVLSQFELERATGIGATDAPKVLGLSRRGTPLSVYREKIGEAEKYESSLPAWLGQQMQATVAELYTARTGNKVRAARQHYRHAEHPWLVCHLDYRVTGQPKRLVECKTRAYMNGWGEEGTEQIPPDVWVQAQHELLVTGAEVCDVVVLFGHHTVKVYEIPRNEAFLEAVVPKLQRFWFDHVIARLPPDPIGSDVDERIVRARHPEVTEPIKAATPDQVPLVKQFLLARYNAKQASAAEQAMKIQIIDLIGAAEGVSGSFGTITYRKPADSVIVEWEPIAKAYRTTIEDVAEAERQELASGGLVYSSARDLDLAAVESIYTRTEPGKRRIDVREAKENAVA